MRTCIVLCVIGAVAAIGLAGGGPREVVATQAAALRGGGICVVGDNPAVYTSCNYEYVGTIPQGEGEISVPLRCVGGSLLRELCKYVSVSTGIICGPGTPSVCDGNLEFNTESPPHPNSWLPLTPSACSAPRSTYTTKDGSCDDPLPVPGGDVVLGNN